MTLATDRLYAFTGFGDQPNTAVKFSILLAGDALPLWLSRGRTATLPIANANRTVRMNIGRGDYEITFRLELDGLDAYAALDAMLQTRSVLRYRWGLTNTAGGVFERMGDQEEYLVLAGTRLDELGEPRQTEPGVIECTATFSRAYGGG